MRTTSKPVTISVDGELKGITLLISSNFFTLMNKNELHGRKSWLAGKKHPVDPKPILMKERLPRYQKEVFEHAKEKF